MQIEVEGLTLTVERVNARGTNIQEGDTYIAKRNGPWQILTVRKVDVKTWAIFPKENAYPFDIGECYKVMSISGQPL